MPEIGKAAGIIEIKADLSTDGQVAIIGRDLQYGGLASPEFMGQLAAAGLTMPEYLKAVAVRAAASCSPTCGERSIGMNVSQASGRAARARSSRSAATA